MEPDPRLEDDLGPGLGVIQSTERGDKAFEDLQRHIWRRERIKSQIDAIERHHAEMTADEFYDQFRELKSRAQTLWDETRGMAATRGEENALLDDLGKRIKGNLQTDSDFEDFVRAVLRADQEFLERNQLLRDVEQPPVDAFAEVQARLIDEAVDAAPDGGQYVRIDLHKSEVWKKVVVLECSQDMQDRLSSLNDPITTVAFMNEAFKESAREEAKRPRSIFAMLEP